MKSKQTDCNQHIGIELSGNFRSVLANEIMNIIISNMQMLDLLGHDEKSWTRVYGYRDDHASNACDAFITNALEL